jgi:agmatinase
MPPNSFGDLPDVFSRPATSRFFVLPVPYERTTTFLKGTRRGPAAILRASTALEYYDEELRIETYREGIHVLPDLDLNLPPEQAVEEIAAKILEIIEREAIPITLGGEHSITAGPVKALMAKYPDLSVLSLDAHADLREEYEGSRWGHASVMKRLIDRVPVTIVGLRSLSREEDDLLEAGRARAFFAHEGKPFERLRDILSSLSDRVYLSVDMDVFDPGAVPGVGTPEPGGLGWYDVVDFLRELCRRKQVVGFDIVELLPLEGSVVSEFTAAKLAYRLMGYLTVFRRPESRNALPGS